MEASPIAIDLVLDAAAAFPIEMAETPTLEAVLVPIAMPSVLAAATLAPYPRAMESVALECEPGPMATE